MSVDTHDRTVPGAWLTHASLAVGLVVFVVVLPFVHGDVTWFDAGELSAASAGLGVPHPTGFPLVVLLGHLASMLPIGSIPFRLALLSALSIAISSGLIHSLVTRYGGCPKRALVGALIFPATFVVWLHAGLVEIYAPNVALIAGLAWLLLRDEPRVQSAAFLTGLGLGAHATFVFSAFALWVLTLHRTRDLRAVGRALPFVLMGGAIVLYLPAAASRDPWLNWGDPSSLGGMVDHLTASGIRSSFAGEMGLGLASNAKALVAWLDLVGGGERWLAPLVSLGLCLRIGSPLHRAALVLLTADAAFSVWLNPMGQADLQTGVPGAWALALGVAALASDTSWEETPRRIIIALALVALVLVGTARSDDRAGDELAGAWARVRTGQVTPGALVLASSDHLASQSLYLEGIEGFRPDLMTLVKQHAPDDRLVRRRYAKEGESVPEGALAIPSEEIKRRVLTLAALEAARRPVIWELGDGRLDGAISDRLLPSRALYRLGGFPGAAAKSGSAEWLTAQVRTLVRQGSPAFRSRRVLSDELRLRGVWHLLRREPALGARVLEAALAIEPDHPPALLNLAAAHYREGDLAAAVELLERALIVDPDYRKARDNLERYRASAPPPSP